DLTLQIGDTLVHAGLGHRSGLRSRDRKRQGSAGTEGVFACGFDDLRYPAGRNIRGPQQRWGSTPTSIISQEV
ncbi:MAG: hypothetical protein OXG98_15770, partial [Gemmatimonadetes bacterium]|nr:hypothetical protein [Gemmatimonadota bacterium]